MKWTERRAAIRRVGMGLVLAVVAVAAGCTGSMPMPREELRIAPLAGSRTPFLEEAGVLTVPGIAHYGAPLASSSGMVAVAIVTMPSIGPSDAAAPSGGAHGALASWDLNTGELLGLIELTSDADGDGWVHLVDLSPDGGLASIRNSASVEVRDVLTGAVRRRLDVSVHDWGHMLPWLGMFDRTGRRVMLTIDPSHMRRWVDVETGEESLGGPPEQCGELTVGFAEERHSPYVLNTRTGERVPLEFQTSRDGTTRGAVFSDDCRYVAIEYDRVRRLLLPDQTPSHVRIWDSSTGRLVAWYQAERGGRSFNAPGLATAILGESQILLVQEDNWIHLIDFGARREIGRDWFTSEGRLAPVVPVDGGRLLLVPGKEGIRMYRVGVPGV